MAVSVASPSFWGVDGIAPKRGLFHVSRPFSVANASTERAAARGQSLDRRVAGRSILDRSSICERHRPAPGPRERNDHQEVVCRPTSRGRSDEPGAAVDRDHFREVARPRSEGSNGWPFAGRERELAAIVRGARGSAAAVVLAGPTGVGKSRLAARGPAELGRYGWSTDTVRGTSSARDTPHRALAHLLPAVMPADVINPLRWAVDQMVPAGQRRRALLVDDAHQLDAASAAVVSHLVEKRRATVLASVRTAEPTPDAIASLWRGDRAEQIELGALSVEETAHTVRGALRGVIEPATPELLAQARTSYSEAAGLRGHYLDSQNAARAALDSIDSWRDAVLVDCRTAAHELDGLRAVGG